MIKSMTGYGRVESTGDGRRYVVEIKSLNHRYLEVSLRLPSILAPFEQEIRKKISEQISRGRVEITIRVIDDECQESGGRLRLNIPLVRNYYDLLHQLRDDLHLPDEITLSMMTAFKDVFVPAEVVEDSVAVGEGAAQAVDEAVALLAEMKKREGEMLFTDMMARISSIKDFLAIITERSPAVVLEYRERLINRVKELLAETEIDESRLHQEIAIMAEKSDITEEIVRLDSHMDQLVDMMNDDAAAGRKVDFLIQEMNREINTIGSKSGDRGIARCVIEIKSELAKLREQAQNLE